MAKSKKIGVEEKKEIKIRVTEKEYDRIKEKADSKHTSLQDYVASAALQRREKKPEYKSYPPEFIEALNYHQSEITELNQTIRELLAVKRPDNYLYYNELEDIALTLRKLCRHETYLYEALGGELHDNTETV